MILPLAILAGTAATLWNAYEPSMLANAPRWEDMRWETLVTPSSDFSFRGGDV
jgi:hypothetical protein